MNTNEHGLKRAGNLRVKFFSIENIRLNNLLSDTWNDFRVPASAGIRPCSSVSIRR